jgi:hypothetical protein
VSNFLVEIFKSEKHLYLQEASIQQQELLFNSGEIFCLLIIVPVMSDDIGHINIILYSDYFIMWQCTK